MLYYSPQKLRPMSRIPNAYNVKKAARDQITMMADIRENISDNILITLIHNVCNFPR